MAMHGSVTTKRLDFYVVVKISHSSLSQWLSLAFFFILQSIVDQMWNCNKDL